MIAGMSDLSDPAPADAAGPATEYRVLARKYRPQTFEDLVGQDALVKTLRNAFAQNRVHHAFMLTGVRGVGKTTTARIVAKGLNCTGPDGSGGPTMTPCGICDNCRSIAEDRHVDVLEMDAASRTGVDDVREIIESVRYRPVSARYKVFIIDEVHMLSKNAFNALLKTLEEPPEHVKFIFATTEIRKVPVTVLSRCQRFDLRRIDAEVLLELFRRVAEKEAMPAEDDALLMVARAADGSARDGLSILDQAMALSEGTVTAEQVREMLGVVDRARIYDLFEAVMAGRVSDALTELKTMHDGGADPVVVIQDLMELTHGVTRMKAAPQAAMANDLSETERERGRKLAETLTVPTLTRTWQMLSKGLGEVQGAPVAFAAAEMVLIRIAHAADLPDPATLARIVAAGGGAVVGGGAGGGSAGGLAAGAPAAPVAVQAQPPVEARGPTAATSGAPEPAAPTTAAPTASAPTTAEPVISADSGPDEPPPPSMDDYGAGSDSGGPDLDGPAAMPGSFSDLVGLFRERGEPVVASQLSSNAHLVSLEPGRLEIRLKPGCDPKLLGQVQVWLVKWTGKPWVVERSDAEGEPTLREQAAAAIEARNAEIAADPVVAKVLDLFPGARIEDVTVAEAPEPAPPGTGPEIEDDPDEDEMLDEARG